jgi:hypothetical protein
MSTDDALEITHETTPNRDGWMLSLRKTVPAAPAPTATRPRGARCSSSLATG